MQRGSQRVQIILVLVSQPRVWLGLWLVAGSMDESIIIIIAEESETKTSTMLAESDENISSIS